MSAAFAGFLAGLIAAALQQVLVVPVLLEAELYESGERIHFASAGQGEAGHAHESHGDGPDSALDRHVTTWLATTALTIGFALIVAAAMAAAERAGHAISARTGLLWGACAFLAFQFAPAIGHPPELPGSAAADLAGRQFWWALTALSTSIGLACIAFGRNWGLWAAGIAALALPHMIGAPHPPDLAGVAPPELSALFATRALGIGLIGFVALGGFLGYFLNRNDPAHPG